MSGERKKEERRRAMVSVKNGQVFAWIKKIATSLSWKFDLRTGRVMNAGECDINLLYKTGCQPSSPSSVFFCFAVLLS